MTPKEQSRLQVLNSLAAEHMTLDQAAELMGVTSRHTRRILAAYRERGAAALAHGHRGRRPVNATPEALVVDVAQLARTQYAGVNHTHMSELLSERDGIDIGRTTLRRILVNAGLSSPRRRRQPKHRVRRQRMPQEGMLIQMDGSHHPWLGVPCLTGMATSLRWIRANTNFKTRILDFVQFDGASPVVDDGGPGSMSPTKACRHSHYIP